MNKQVKRNIDIRIFGRHLLSLNSCRLWQQIIPKLDALPAKSLPADTPETKDREPVYVINSLMLYDCFNILTQTESENLHAITGSVVGNVRSLERVVPLSLSTQNPVGAVADNESLVGQLIHLNDFGMRPLAYFHSHPGSSVSATCPSGTDRRTQSMMEQSGSDIIGGIFSRDGFIRFYANGFTPNVKVIGKKVRRIKKNVYKLEIEENL